MIFIQLWLEIINCANYEFVTTEEVPEVIALKNKERNERKKLLYIILIWFAIFTLLILKIVKKLNAVSSK